MISASTDTELWDAFQQHFEKIPGQIEWLDRLIEAIDGVRLNRMNCHVIKGLAEKAQEITESVEADPVRDTGLTGAVLKVEYYEIATYGTLHALALKLC